MDAEERTVVDNVKKFGCHVRYVFDDQGVRPDFTYSVGIQKTTGSPEIVIYGLPKDLAHNLVNNYSDRCRAGQQHTVGVAEGGLVPNMNHTLISVARRHYREHFGLCGWFYNGGDFDVVQLVWPDREGRFPWDAGVSSEFLALQPILS